jgi:glutamate racemase
VGDPCERPIGVFDSGVGGLTVLASIAALLPGENLLYLGDTARVPYGTKSAATVTAYSLEIAQFFMEREVKAIVVACNTASAMALPHLRESFSVPMVGVVSPGAGAAVRATRNGRVGIIGTEATLASGAYPEAIAAVDESIEIFTRACPLFVPLAEEGWIDNEITRAVVARYLAPLRDREIDTLLLGCTHYPLLAPIIGDFLGPQVTVVDSAEATAQALRESLKGQGLLGSAPAGEATFCVTDVPDRFIQLGSRFYGNSVEAARRIELRPSAGFAANHTSG